MSVNKKVLEADIVTLGSATGEVLVLDEPLSLWGGIDVASGIICDQTHPQVGCSLKDKVLIMSSGRGSSSSSSTLLEAAREGTAPKAIVMQRPDTILAIGALVAADLYQVQIPIVIVKDDDWARLIQFETLQIEALHDRAYLTELVAKV